MTKKVELFTIRKDVECLKCGNIGAIQSYGKYYPNGVGELADEIKSYEDVRNKPHMDHSMGFGGTIPYKCMNCKNAGLVDFGGLEGYKKAFKSIKSAEE
jgi:DNA-directed RNA polymerase subunit RPC12/RpoP